MASDMGLGAVRAGTESLRAGAPTALDGNVRIGRGGTIVQSMTLAPVVEQRLAGAVAVGDEGAALPLAAQRCLTTVGGAGTCCNCCCLLHDEC